MAGRKRLTVPAELARGRDRFESWRQTCPAGTRIPSRLWSLAVALAETHGVSRTASVLKLDHNALKRRMTAKAPESRTSLPEFIELPPSLHIPLKECLVELEDGSDVRIRIHMKGFDRSDLETLVRNLRGRE